MTTARRHAAILATTALGAILSTPPTTGQPPPKTAGCGFQQVNPDHHNGATARYVHCADSFILIRVDTADGSHHRCVEPWGSVEFPASTRVRNAYYVPIPPRLITTSDNRRICSLSQPPV